MSGSVCMFDVHVVGGIRLDLKSMKKVNFEIWQGVKNLFVNFFLFWAWKFFNCAIFLCLFFYFSKKGFIYLFFQWHFEQIFSLEIRCVTKGATFVSRRVWGIKILRFSYHQKKVISQHKKKANEPFFLLFFI